MKRDSCIFFMLQLACSVALSCTSPADKMSMAAFLSHDADFSASTCGEIECTDSALADLMEVRSEAIRRYPQAAVCIVEPIRKSTNMFIGVFVAMDGRSPMPQFVFFGSGIKVLAASHRGVNDLEGSEIAERPHVALSRFRWNGVTYQEVTTPRSGAVGADSGMESRVSNIGRRESIHDQAPHAIGEVTPRRKIDRGKHEVT